MSKRYYMVDKRNNAYYHLAGENTPEKLMLTINRLSEKAIPHILIVEVEGSDMQISTVPKWIEGINETSTAVTLPARTFVLTNQRDKLTGVPLILEVWKTGHIFEKLKEFRTDMGCRTFLVEYDNTIGLEGVFVVDQRYGPTSLEIRPMSGYEWLEARAVEA